MNGRIYYEKLCQAAALIIAKNPRAAQAFRNRTRYPSQLSSRISSIIVSRPTSTRSLSTRGYTISSNRSSSSLEEDIKMPNNEKIFEEDEE